MKHHNLPKAFGLHNAAAVNVELLNCLVKEGTIRVNDAKQLHSSGPPWYSGAQIQLSKRPDFLCAAQTMSGYNNEKEQKKLGVQARKTTERESGQR